MLKTTKTNLTFNRYPVLIDFVVLENNSYPSHRGIFGLNHPPPTLPTSPTATSPWKFQFWFIISFKNLLALEISLSPRISKTDPSWGHRYFLDTQSLNPARFYHKWGPLTVHTVYLAKKRRTEITHHFSWWKSDHLWDDYM